MRKKLKTRVPFVSKNMPTIEIIADVFCSPEGEPRFATILEMHSSARGQMSGLFLGSLPEKYREQYRPGSRQVSERELKKIAKRAVGCIYLEKGKKYAVSAIEAAVGELTWEAVR